jgi:hypothetical protein
VCFCVSLSLHIEMAPILFSDLGKRAKGLFELPVKSGFHSKTTWHASEKGNGKIHIGYDSLLHLSGGGAKPTGLFVQWASADDPSGVEFVELKPGGHHQIKGKLTLNEEWRLNFDFEDSDTYEDTDRHVAIVGCTMEKVQPCISPNLLEAWLSYINNTFIAYLPRILTHFKLQWICWMMNQWQLYRRSIPPWKMGVS